MRLEEQKMTSNLFILVIPLLAYLLLATGKIFPFTISDCFFPFHTIIYCCLIVYLFQSRRFRLVFYYSTAYILIPLFIFSISTFHSYDIINVLTKFEGAFFVTHIVVCIVTFYIDRLGTQKFIDHFIYISLLVLIITISYKLFFGFSNRSVRFFLNGPIVFGWIMGLVAMFCLYSAAQGYSAFINSGLFIVFVLAVIWTQSKGPILALFFVSGLILFSNFNFKFIRHVVGSIILLCAILLILVPDDLILRYYAILRFFQNSLENLDMGSIGVRILLWEEALTLWMNNPLFGIGIGNWEFFTTSTFLYPHNIFLEILSEGGLFTIFAFLLFMSVVFYKTTKIGRLIIIFFAICISFSGDSSYLRYIIAIPIAFCISKYHMRQSLSPKNNS